MNSSNLYTQASLEVLAPPPTVQLHPLIQATYSYVVQAADGTVVSDSGGERPCESYLQAFSKVLFHRVFALGIGSGSSVALTNGWLATSSDTLGMKVAGIINQATIGPLVGIGSIPVAITHSSLVTQVSHGTGANQLQHAAVTFAAPTVSGTATTFTVTRVFTNASAGALVVKEIGLGGAEDSSPTFSTSTGTQGAVLIVRDLIGGGTGVSVGSGAQLTLNINLRTNV